MFIKLPGINTNTSNNSQLINLCTYGQLIEDARIILNSLQVWSVHYIKMEANGVAHRLAKEAFSLRLTSPQVLCPNWTEANAMIH